MSNNKKTIVFVTPSLNYGGAERVISIIANNLSENNFNVSIICMNDNRNISYELSTKVELFWIDSVRFNAIKNILSSIIELRNCIKQIKPDIIISFFNNTLVFSWFAQIGLNIPLVFSERNDPYNNIKGIKAIIFQKLAMRLSNKIIFQTKGAQNYYKTKSVLKKSTIIYNPLNKPSIKKDHNQSLKQIVCVGRLTKQKNHELLIKAFSEISLKYTEYILIIYGDGELRSQLTKLISDLGLVSKVKLPGNVNNIQEKICNASMFVFTSDYEGIPNALLEAMSIGLPCISTDCSPGGAREFINHKSNGLLIPCNDKGKLIDAISYYIDNPKIASDNGNNARSILDNISIEEIIKKWINLFNEIIKD